MTKNTEVANANGSPQHHQSSLPTVRCHTLESNDIRAIQVPSNTFSLLRLLLFKQHSVVSSSAAAAAAASRRKRDRSRRRRNQNSWIMKQHPERQRHSRLSSYAVAMKPSCVVSCNRFLPLPVTTTLLQLTLMMMMVMMMMLFQDKYTTTAFQPPTITTTLPRLSHVNTLSLSKNVNGRRITALSYSLPPQLDGPSVSGHYRLSQERRRSIACSIPLSSSPTSDTIAIMTSTTSTTIRNASWQMMLLSPYSCLTTLPKRSFGSVLSYDSLTSTTSTSICTSSSHPSRVWTSGGSSSSSGTSRHDPTMMRRTRGVLGFQIHSHDVTISPSSLSSTLQEHARTDIADHVHPEGSVTNHPFLTSDYTTDPITTTTTTTTDNHPTNNRRMYQPDHSKNSFLWRKSRVTADHTRLQANIISNVDSMAWNLPEPLIGTSSSSSSSSVATFENDDNGSSATSTRALTVPWIPTENDIDQLTVVQLKNELGLRALKKEGNKYLLQNRFKEWIQQSSSSSRNNPSTNGRQRDRSNLLSSTKVTSFLEQEIPSWGIDSSSFLNDLEVSPKTEDDPYRPAAHSINEVKNTEEPLLLNVDSLQEWARTVDLEPLLHRREAIHREKLVAPPKQPPASKLDGTASSVQNKELPSDLRKVIQKMFDQPSSIYSNWEVKQMYAAAKHADQMGDRILSKRILYELKTATPNDARIYRRIARMELEDNNDVVARSVLQEGIALHPENAYLWHGLGQLEGTLGNVTAQRRHWEKAIEVDPYVPNSYHALGIFDHTCGRVANAMKILKQGIHYCPTNHRLHHALGDIYRDAKMLPLARMSYQKAIQHGPLVSHGFAYTALSYVAYEEGNIEQCRHYLRKAVHLNNGRHANGWVALAQMEESEGNIEAARTACMVGIGQYERGLIEQSRRTVQQQNMNPMENSVTSDRRTLSLSDNPVTLRNKILQTIPTYRSGDRFFNVYRNWLRLEERYGTIDTFEEVYERAVVAFPHEYKIMIDAAQYFIRLNLFSRARAAFTKACCVRSNHPNMNAEPYRLFAEFEMQMGNYLEAQKILYSGAMTMSKYSSSAFNTSRRGLPQLFLTWAVCEWHLNNPTHAEKLFDYSLRLTSSVTEESPKLRSMILYAMARFEYDRKELRRAQHFVGLSLKENALPGGQCPIWDLWATVAYEMGNIKLAHQCQEQSSIMRANLEQYGNDVGDSGRNEDTMKSLSETLKSSSMNDTPDMYQLMRRDPWHTKIFTGTNFNDKNNFLNAALLPQSSDTNAASVQYR